MQQFVPLCTSSYKNEHKRVSGLLVFNILHVKYDPMSMIVPFRKWLEEHPTNNKNDEKLFLSEEEIRKFTQFQDATPKEIENIINTLHTLALITYEIFCKENTEIARAA
jgi:hypothetical protein